MDWIGLAAGLIGSLFGRRNSDWASRILLMREQLYNQGLADHRNVPTKIKDAADQYDDFFARSTDLATRNAMAAYRANNLDGAVDTKYVDSVARAALPIARSRGEVRANLFASIPGLQANALNAAANALHGSQGLEADMYSNSQGDWLDVLQEILPRVFTQKGKDSKKPKTDDGRADNGQGQDGAARQYSVLGDKTFDDWLYGTRRDRSWPNVYDVPSGWGIRR